MKDQCRLDIREYRYSFSQRTINERNRLSADCVEGSNDNMFINKIYKYFKRAGFLLLISQWLPCPLATWVFALHGNLVKSC